MARAVRHHTSSAPAEIAPVRQRAAEFVAIVEAAQDAILAKDLEGVITSWNGGAERLYGWSAQEAVGRHISLIIPIGLEGEEASLLNRVARDETVPGFETQRIAKDGSIRHVSLTHLSDALQARRS